ncbi:MAG TPA: Ig-like domain-containing protein, partial [Planctomycetota bacterium]|nr:Ig-like domain-containing protein [Planctomycetota bacterium]
ELLASPEPIVAFDVALDGSGRAIFAGTNPSYALADLGVLDSSEPLDTGAVAAVFPIPGQTRSVLVAGGLAYVAAADLHVVSYVPYDTLGVPPSIAFEMGTLITQRVAEEGKLVSVGVDASDDVQLREAQLYVDGELAAVDVSYPFSFEIETPRLADQSSFTLLARAVDTGGNTSETPLLSIDLVADGTPPTIVFVNPPDGSTLTEEAAQIFVTFSEPIDLRALDTHFVQLTGAGADGELGTGDDVAIEVSALSFRAEIDTVVVHFDSPLPSDRYEASVATSVRDLAGNSLGDPFVWTFEIIDTPDLSRRDSFEISSAGLPEGTVHSFLAPAGQLVYFDERIPCNTAEVRWECVDEDGAVVVANQPLEDCGTSDAGRRVLERGGRYDIRVTGVGMYRFAVRNVIISEFEIATGDEVSEDSPAPGAGILEMPGEIDIYYFVASAGYEVYFDEIAPVCEIDIVWELRDEGGDVIFGNDTPLSGCSLTNQGTVRLDRGGLYSLTVECRANGAGGSFDDIDDGIGPYSFRLWPIEPGAFEIELGETVSEDSPEPGAGTIESPGNYDLYTFDVAAGTTVRFDELGPPCGASPVWSLFDPSGAPIF